LSQAVYQGSPRRKTPGSRSGATAAFLSFIFPGLGQAYLGKRREALIFAVPVLVVFLLFAVWLTTTGFTRAGAKLLDPKVALFFALLAVALGVWWILGIVHAARSGPRTSTAALLPAALVVVVGVVAIYAANWAYRVSVADPSLTSSVDCTIQACDYGPTLTPASPGAPGQSALPGTPANSSSGSQTPTGAAPTDTSGADATDDPYDNYGEDPTEPPATIEPGPSPTFDITKLDAQDDGWLNVLLLGLDTRCAGGIVTGAHTDSMIVVSANTTTNQVYMFSFPRDTSQFPLYVGGTMPGYWKLNTFAGYTKLYPDSFPEPGQPSLSYEIGFLLGMPIDYYASINICGFPQLIDAIGGVDVCVKNPIDDPSYPHGDGTLGFSISAGEHHMDGATALAYARSRHGSSDFARAKRQQQLLTAIRAAIVQPQNLANLPNIITAMGDVVHTNFPPDQIDQLVTISNQIDKAPTAQYVFDFPDWAQHLPRTETNGRSVQFLKMDRIEALSQSIFGDKSAYWTGNPVPSLSPQPSPTDSPEPSDTTSC
jgi:LCP family protein required for cell wall assembly